MISSELYKYCILTNCRSVAIRASFDRYRAPYIIVHLRQIVDARQDVGQPPT